jgi:ABC-type nitrate/sulfonate/bicarbonate transport system permease component
MSGPNAWLERLAGALGVVILIAAWELAARLVWRDPGVLPAPSEAAAIAWRTLGLREFIEHAFASLWRIVAGFAIGALAGIALGIASGWYRLVAIFTRPLVEVLRPIPPLAWIPIAIVWFGLGEPSKIFVIFLGAFFPVFTAAHRGMSGIAPVILRAARTMDVDGVGLLLRVALPAALPDIATGLRIGFGLSFGILVAAELIAADRGLGHLVMQARQLGQLGTSIFAIFVIGILNLVADNLLGRAIRHTIGRWSPA